MHFVDLKAQYYAYKNEILEEIGGVLESVRFIKGPAITEFEQMLKEYCGVKHAIGCSSGTDALLLGILAKGINPGDEVIVPDFTFIATAEILPLIGAIPVFIDIKPDTYNIDPLLIEKRITSRTKGIIAVSLFGQCADFDVINDIAMQHNLWVMEDAAQSFGAYYKKKRSCNLTELATTSFFPAKPLGCYGDSGAVFTNDDRLAEKIRTLLNHGQTKRYVHSCIGINGRMDSIQAAILKVKLKHFDEELKARQKVASLYTEGLNGIVKTPHLLDHNTSVWAQYTVVHEKRDHIIRCLKEKGIPVAIHYPIPLHQQEAFLYLHNTDVDFPVAMEISKKVFSLPMHPYMKDDDIIFITDTIKRAVYG